nr:TRAP transporter substrate-binding protein [Sedimentibacter sp.]
MYFCDYIYSKDKNCIIGLDTSIKNINSIPKGFLSIKLFASNGSPIENAYIRISELDNFNKFVVNINAIGYCPVKINNVQFYPNLLCKLKVNLYPIQLKNQTMSQNQIINLPVYENIQCVQNMLETTQDGIRELSLTLGIDSPTDTLTYLYAKKFAEEVCALSNGKIKIEVFTDATMGADRQMLRTIIQNGYPDFIVQTTAPEVDFVPKLALFDMPMVYTDIEDLRNTIDNDLFFEKISNAYTDSKYKLLGMADIFFRQMTSNKKIQNIKDFQEIKIRTIQNRNHEAFWKFLGATVIPLPAGEIYPSLKFNYINAQENPYDVIVGFNLYEVQDYLINTYHLPHLLPLITSDEFYNSLTPSEKSIIDEAAIRATAYAREKADERYEERKQILIDNGMTIVDLSEEIMKAMRCLSLPLYEDICNKVNDPELVNIYLQNSNNF